MDTQHARLQLRYHGTDAGGTKQPADACVQGSSQYHAAAAAGTKIPADASKHGALSYEDLSVLHYFQGERCDILFTSERFQKPSIAALLREVLGKHGMGSYGVGQTDESRAFLEALLGPERAQAAEAAVLQGGSFEWASDTHHIWSQCELHSCSPTAGSSACPRRTVITRKLPAFEVAPPSIGSESCCSSLPQSAAKLAKLTLQTDQSFSRLPSSMPRCMQLFCCCWDATCCTWFECYVGLGTAFAVCTMLIAIGLLVNAMAIRHGLCGVHPSNQSECHGGSGTAFVVCTMLFAAGLLADATAIRHSLCDVHHATRNQSACHGGSGTAFLECTLAISPHAVVGQARPLLYVPLQSVYMP
eukprot:1159377-Pelagomonas_calceolata.AAC.3